MTHRNCCFHNNSCCSLWTNFNCMTVTENAALLMGIRRIPCYLKMYDLKSSPYSFLFSDISAEQLASVKLN